MHKQIREDKLVAAKTNMMRKTLLMLVAVALTMMVGTTDVYAAKKKPKKAKMEKQELWPDGTPMDDWFMNVTKVDVGTLGRKYVVTDYGVVKDSTIVQTQKIQAVIDRCSEEGGGVVVIPEGTYLSGALFFKKGTHLHVIGKLKGSDRIIDFPYMKTRIEGETCTYFCALVDADGLDGLPLRARVR